MQLVYVWIKKNENEFIENKGFNFYGEHYFETLANKEGTFTLKYNKLNNIGSDIFKNVGVENITAIVGENGTGKTTFMEELKILGKPKYKGEYIQVFMDNDFFYYNTNIPKSKVKFEVEIKEISLSQTNLSRILTSNSYYINNCELWDCTLSEISKYGKKFFELLYKIDSEINIRNKSIEDIINRPNEGYDFLNDLYYSKEVNFGDKFQAICNLLFYYNVFKEEKKFLGKNELEISFKINKYEENQFFWIPILDDFINRNTSKYSKLGKQLYSSLITELIQERFFETGIYKYYFFVFQEKKHIEELFDFRNINKNMLEIFMCYLATNNIFINWCDKEIEMLRAKAREIVSLYNENDDYSEVNLENGSLYESIDEVLRSSLGNQTQIDVLMKCKEIEIIDDIGEDDFSGLELHVKSVTINLIESKGVIDRCFEEFILHNIEGKNYDDVVSLLIGINKENTTVEMEKIYTDAFSEINEFLDITSNNISYKISKDDGKRLMEFIRRKIVNLEDTPSFILRQVMEINGLAMSSGERAMINLFSWINIIPQLPIIAPPQKESIKKNILLLIDEIDLYVHPEWQRQLIQQLCKTVTSIYDQHSVQIIITTHSPFVLSDIPSENIIYLSPQNDKLCIEDVRIETFGANIYSILKKSFFMKSTMGEFSKSIISEINNKLDAEKLSEEEYEKNSKIIKGIGEPIIRNHLEEKLKKSSQRDQKIARLEAEILLLRSEANDKN